jgi:hypothetical protein
MATMIVIANSMQTSAGQNMSAVDMDWRGQRSSLAAKLRAILRWLKSIFKNRELCLNRLIDVAQSEASTLPQNGLPPLTTERAS